MVAAAKSKGSQVWKPPTESECLTTRFFQFGCVCIRIVESKIKNAC